MNLHEDMIALGKRSLAAARELVLLGSRKKNTILRAMADELDARRVDLLEINARELEEGHDAGTSDIRLERLRLSDAYIDAMIKGLRDVSDLGDPIGEKISRWIRPNGLEIVKQRVSIGVIAVIYEADPSVTTDAVALCIKAGNTIILRGGKEAFQTNQAIADALIDGGRAKGLPEHAIEFVRTTDRAAVTELVQLEEYVDLVIPRGGEELIRVVVEQARVPVIKHFSGVCHTYVDESADQQMAVEIVEDAKCRAPSASNSVETVLVHREIASEFLPKLAAALGERGVTLRGGGVARKIFPEMEEADESDWSTEHHSLTLAVRVVDSAKDAVAHINRYGTHHSDAVIAESESVQKSFCREVDSAAVYVNASTGFTDGAEFGMGVAIAITTDKLHARGPMGLEGLTTYKYLIHGKGQVRK